MVGDMASLDRLPGVAQVAIQGGQHTAREIRRALQGEPTGEPFHYKDKGSMATISRFHAVASVGRLNLSGFVAWVLWLAVHLLYLVGFKNRVTTLLKWTITFLGRGRSERAVTQQQIIARTVIKRTGPRGSVAAFTGATPDQPAADGDEVDQGIHGGRAGEGRADLPVDDDGALAEPAGEDVAGPGRGSDQEDR